MLLTSEKDGNKVEPLPQQASVNFSRIILQLALPKIKQRTINKILPTYHIETKLIL